MVAPNNSKANNGNSKGKKTSSSAFFTVLTHLIVGLFCFNVGLLFGSSSTASPVGNDCPTTSSSSSSSTTSRQTTGTTGTKEVFNQKTMNKFLVGAATINKRDFLETFDTGLPWDEHHNKGGNDEVFMIYTHPDSLPDNAVTGGITEFASARDATKNCQVLKVVYTTPRISSLPHTCLAVVGQWDSYHVHRYMRLPEKMGQPMDNKVDLRYVSRHHLTKGKTQDLPPAKDLVGPYGAMLIDYLQKLPATLKRLGPVAKKAAGKGNTVVVMVCNFGQSELLLNFVCSSRSRGFDLSKIVVFATDNEVAELAKELDLNVFEVGDAFGEMPTEAARRYGDKKFKGMMYAKVYCVQLINMLGYDLLFQDVDVVWYKDPLKEFFDKHHKESDFDLYFQDDGARSARYIPYSPNTGFYFVRHNERTEYLFSAFARMGDVIKESSSHQSALTSLMADHSSYRGLKVKVFGRDDPKYGHLFPGGFHYHTRRSFMKDLVSGKTDPIIFHMSWTMNKDNKVKFLQQMEDWFVADKCVHKTLEEIEGSGSLISRCCLAKADFQCHYRDKPSRRPCKSSPPIDKGKRSFW